MNLYITSAIVLLVMLATLHYLAKVRAENLGSFLKWSGYLVLTGATLLLICLLFRGVRKMTHRMKGDRMEYSQHGRMDGMESCSGMEDCKGKDKMNCGPGMQMKRGGCCSCCGDMMMDKGQGMPLRKRGTHSESSVDTVDGKIIKKEIEITEQ